LGSLATEPILRTSSPAHTLIQKIFAKIEETKQIDVRKHFNKHQQELKLVPSVEEH